jgi:hypothetical protein
MSPGLVDLSVQARHIRLAYQDNSGLDAITAGLSVHARRM